MWNLLCVCWGKSIICLLLQWIVARPDKKEYFHAASVAANSIMGPILVSVSGIPFWVAFDAYSILWMSLAAKFCKYIDPLESAYFHLLGTQSNIKYEPSVATMLNGSNLIH